MRVHPNATSCSPALGVTISVAEFSVSPRPAGAHHERLQVVIACKAQRDRMIVLAVVVDLLTGYWPSADEADQRLGRQGVREPFAVVARLTLLWRVYARTCPQAASPNFTVSPSETAKPASAGGE
jgi:hypothetical protein